MVRPSANLLSQCALVGALVIAALLAGCGRKGPLELPPSATSANPGAAPAPASAPPAMTPEGYPVAPPGERRPIPLDWLID